jgi:hypothetical protein
MMAERRATFYETAGCIEDVTGDFAPGDVCVVKRPGESLAYVRTRAGAWDRLGLEDVAGPAQLPCPRQCDVPEGVVLRGVPRPRHAWGDVLPCPYADCGRAWLIVATRGS